MPCCVPMLSTHRTSQVFICLIGCFTSDPGILHWYDVGQHYGGRKPGRSLSWYTFKRTALDEASLDWTSRWVTEAPITSIGKTFRNITFNKNQIKSGSGLYEELCLSAKASLTRHNASSLTGGDNKQTVLGSRGNSRSNNTLQIFFRTHS